MQIDPSVEVLDMVSTMPVSFPVMTNSPGANLDNRQVDPQDEEQNARNSLKQRAPMKSLATNPAVRSPGYIDFAISMAFPM